jgi:hypothetical protein
MGVEYVIDLVIDPANPQKSPWLNLTAIVVSEFPDGVLHNAVVSLLQVVDSQVEAVDVCFPTDTRLDGFPIEFSWVVNPDPNTEINTEPDEAGVALALTLLIATLDAIGPELTPTESR